MRVFLGAFGQPGHAFPMLALGAELAARGHEVSFETWTRWRAEVEAAGMRFVAAPEYQVFPTTERPLKPYEAVVRATAGTRAAIRRVEADVVVHDILTLAPAMAGELEGVPVGTLIPHVHPASAPGAPPYALGARLARTELGRRFWGWGQHLIEGGLRRGRSELNETRRQLGLPPVQRLHGGLSPTLVLVGTFPQLEYPREWPPGTRVVGPLMWEPPCVDVEPPAGDEPLVLVAPSTAQDPGQVLLSTALRGLRHEPVRVLATTNRKPLPRPLALGPRTRLVDWLSYARSMPLASLVITHAGHGTVVRALASGCPVLAVPHSGDMGENAARVDWAGVGRRLPWRLLTPRTLRLAVRSALEDQRLTMGASQLAGWARTHRGAALAADLVEALAASEGRDAGPAWATSAGGQPISELPPPRFFT